MGLFEKRKKKAPSTSAAAVQTAVNSSHPYRSLASYQPLSAETAVYAKLREAVPILDAALNKIVRLTDGFSFETGNDSLNAEMNTYFENINVGGNQKGLSSFISNYLNQLLTFGTAVGEMVVDGSGLYALYNSSLSNIELKRNENGIDVDFYNFGEKLKYPNLVLYSVLNPQPEQLCGTSLLSGLPFLSDILMKIYNTIGENWEHAGNVRYAVICKPSENADLTDASVQAETVAQAWKSAMDSSSVKDFVAVGDVSIKVIGGDKEILDSEIPVRQILEQLVAKTGIPPFMLGLSWSSTERMSTQQADILTTELEAYRRILTPVITKIGNMYLALSGRSCDLKVNWDEITLQDEKDSAQAELYLAQAEKIKREAEM
ncbi:MAG: serine/threonine protein phosphatase [Eubacteriales bacterium]|nr:serine/threonine protein phosphatase [Eubacteriales bacterium]